MTPDLFLADLQEKPDRLRSLQLQDSWAFLPATREILLLEGPRLPAVGCETGDWRNVDVYLTRTTDHRMLLLGGSRWEPQLLDWTSRRSSTVVGVGADVPGASPRRPPGPGWPTAEPGLTRRRRRT